MRRNAVRLWIRRLNRFLYRPRGWGARTSFAHVGIEQQRTGITKNKFFFLNLVIILMLSLVFSAQPAFAHDPPVILPTRLDFDASQAPKSCNAVDSFSGMLGAWIPKEVLQDDADRRLIVRLQSSAKGGKRADVSLVDGQGVVLAERHATYASRVECHKVLWEVARDAAKMLGAFEPPPPKEPVPAPVCAPCASCPQPRSCPTFPPLRPTTPTLTLLPTPYRSFIGLGAFAGSGIFSKMAAGPNLLLGFVPSRRLSPMHIEVDATWTAQTSQSIRVHSIPMAASLCWVQGILRFCGGVSTTIFLTNRSRTNDELLMMLGGNLRLGTELFRHGSFSIRADVFGRLIFAPQQFGKALGVIDEPTPFAAGVAVMAMRAFD